MTVYDFIMSVRIGMHGNNGIRIEKGFNVLYQDIYFIKADIIEKLASNYLFSEVSYIDQKKDTIIIGLYSV